METYFKRFDTFLSNLAESKGFRVLFVASTVAILALTVTYTALKTAYIHANNADQLIDNYLFESIDTFTQAQFPAAHTFLIKWPLFALMSFLGNTQAVITGGTVLFMLITIMGLLFILHRITKNSIATGLIALLLTSVLLLVPIRPPEYSLLPINFAMITTRNIEYLVFLGYLYLISTTTMRRRHFWGAVVTLTLLGASDKFFLLISLAATLLLAALAVYRNYQDVRRDPSTVLPLASVALAFVLSTILLISIDRLGTTNLDSPANASPFTFATSIQQMISGVIYAIEDTLINFGANFFGRSASLSALPYLFNGLILAVLIYLSLKVLRLKSSTDKHTQHWSSFHLLLILSSIAAYTSFVVSNHEYRVDARYLTIAVFALFVSLALYVRRYRVNNTLLLATSGVVLLMLPLSGLAARSMLQHEIAAIDQDMVDRFSKAGSIAKEKRLDAIVGDYWMVTPVRYYSGTDLPIAAVANGKCNIRHRTLTSGAWYHPSKNPRATTAYYLLRDPGEAETYNGGCTLRQLEDIFGTPDERIVLRGNASKAVDILQIYNYDIRKNVIP